MRMLNIDLKDTNKLSRITRDEAYEFLSVGVPIVCRVSSREFQEVDQIVELENIERLRGMKVYDLLELYLQ